MIAALLLPLACAHLPPAALAPAEGRVLQFGIEIGGRSLAGLAVVDLSAEGARLQALTSFGTEVFRVEAGPGGTAVAAADPAWVEALARLPIERDLRLALGWSCPDGRCAAGEGRVEERAVEGGVERIWRGPEGPATARIRGNRAVLTDPVRGYTLTLVEARGDR